MLPDLPQRPVSEQHLSRYLAEFDFRHSYRQRLGVDDAARAHLILKGAEGTRLTYRQGSLTKDAGFRRGRDKLRLILGMIEQTDIDA